MSLKIEVFALLILAQIWLSMSHFVFELEVDLDSVKASCRDNFLEPSYCRRSTYFSVFCLREGREGSQSTNAGDCPLGQNTERMNTYEGGSNTRRITSQTPWPVNFQLYINAWDSDRGPSDDDFLDDVIINRALDVNTGFTAMEEHTGIHNSVTFKVRFRVICQSNYYGADCNRFCEAQNDMNGHYTCNNDGSIQCLEGFENRQNNCKDMITPCDSSVCANNGSCIPMGPFEYTCQCVTGYTGLSCEADIDDCLSATCPNNSTCVDGINTYKCVCNPDFMLDGNRCVTQIGEPQGTLIIPDVTTGSASEAESGNKKASPTVLTKLHVVAMIVVLIVIALIVFIMVLIVVIIKWKRKRACSIHREYDGKWMKSLSAKMVDNPTYYGQLAESSSVIYEAPKRTSLEATVHIVDNPIYGEDVNYNPVNDETIRNVQNPIYGDNDVGESMQDRLYEVAKSPRALHSLADGENKGLEYDYITAK